MLHFGDSIIGHLPYVSRGGDTNRHSGRELRANQAINLQSFFRAAACSIERPSTNFARENVNLTSTEDLAGQNFGDKRA